MSLKIINLFIFAICISLVVADVRNSNDDKSSVEENIQEYSNSNKKLLLTEKEDKKNDQNTGPDSQKQSSNKLRKALNQQNLDLELAIVTTKLEELNKLKEAEKIDGTTPSASLTKWQKRVLNDINKSEKKKEDLTKKVDVSKPLVEQLPTLLSPVQNEKTIKYKTKKIIKALEAQQKINLELYISTVKLKQLEKVKETEEKYATAANNKLKKWQTNLLNEIMKTKEKKGDLTVGAAVIKTKIDVLKQQLTAAGGDPERIPSAPNKNAKKIKEKLERAEDNLRKTKEDLAEASTNLGRLDANSNDIDKARHETYSLALKAAVEEALVHQLRMQLSPNEKSPEDGSVEPKE